MRAGELTNLQIGGGGLTLQGGGHVQLSDSSSNFIGAASDSATLVNSTIPSPAPAPSATGR